jgi:hypothetical protein
VPKLGTIAADQAQVDWLASVSADPYGFVMGAFPWGEQGSLENADGPQPWQRELLNRIADGLSWTEAVQEAVASGHGVGKSTLVAWIIIWAMATMANTRGVVTANTETQLRTKTWAELGKWFNLLLPFIRDKFHLSATALFSRDKETERTWRIDMVPWTERNTEAFAGLHNQGHRIVVIFDEASAIPDIIWETTEGALTDANTEIIWCVFGNPTRHTGRFRECFDGGRFAEIWHTTQVDSRTISFTNKDQIARWVKAWGEDSDFVRIRVRGTFPRHGEFEFIAAGDVADARRRELEPERLAPLLMGVDVARYGSNESVIFFRCGRDGRSIPPLRFRGLNTVELASRVASEYHRHEIDAVFVDGGGVGGGVIDNLRHLHVPCFDIQFGGKPDQVGYAEGAAGEKYANKRAEMWGMLRSWLKTACIPDENDIAEQLIGPTFTLNLRSEILLESKEMMAGRGLPSPDIADAMALTFAYPIAPKQLRIERGSAMVESEYDPVYRKTNGDYDPVRREAA